MRKTLTKFFALRKFSYIQLYYQVYVIAGRLFTNCLIGIYPLK